MAKLVISAYLTDLHKHFGYPAEILQFDYKNKLSVMLTNALWDIPNGCVLKLVDMKEVTLCLRGFECLN